MIKKFIAVLFVTMILASFAQADYSPEDLINIELDGNMGPADC